MTGPRQESRQSAWDLLQTQEAERAAAIRAMLGDQIDAIVAAEDFGSPSAAKRGQNPQFPYVPIVQLPGVPGRTRQLRGLAYSTREEAVGRARAQIEAWRRKLADDLAKPRYRALRAAHGLPRDPNLAVQETDQ